MKNKNNLIYPDINPEDYVKHYEVHINAMTLEGLHDKSQIAAQLAWRDAQIEKLTILLDQKILECQEAQSLLPPFLGGSGESLRKVYVCRSCEGIYGDSPVSSCDCFPNKHEFDSGVLLLDKKTTNAKKLTVTLQGTECDRYKRMFEAACVALGEIGDVLGCDPNEGGSELILDAIAELKESAKPTVPTVESAHAMGAKGAEPTEAERLLFEAWMRGHCWALSSHWDGKQYVSDDENNGGFSAHAMGTRRLWAAWRDRAALSSPPCPVEFHPQSL